MRSKNEKHFIVAFGEQRYREFDVEYLEKRRTEVQNQPFSLADWQQEKMKASVVADMNIRKEKILEKYTRMIGHYKLGNGFEQYINDDENDPHLLNFIVNSYQSLKELGFDTSVVSTLGGQTELLVVLDPWDGQGLLELLQLCKPKHLIVAFEKCHK